MNSLDDKGLSNHPIFLVCVQEEIEAWLLADERAINKFLSTDAHPIKTKRQRNTERVKNPKKVLTKHFQKHKGIKYSDLTHAKKLIENIEDFKRLKKCGTFVRFILKSVDIQI